MAYSIFPIEELILFLILNNVETKKNSFLAASDFKRILVPGFMTPVSVLPYGFTNPTYLIDDEIVMICWHFFL